MVDRVEFVDYLQSSICKTFLMPPSHYSQICKLVVVLTVVDSLLRYLCRGHAGVVFNARWFHLCPSRFQLQNSHVLPTVRVKTFSIDLGRNSDYFCVRH
jgi:hypothetical protein